MHPVLASGYRKMEYLLVIDIPESLRHKIEKAREELAAGYAVRQPRAGRPHIGLARFTALQQQETKITTRLREISLAQAPFLVEFSDFGGYPMHCIYITIRTKEKIKQLITSFKSARPVMRTGGDAPHFLEDPVIPLAARMDKDNYLAAMKEYSTKHFSGRFVAASVLLLKRGGKNERYQIAARFELEHLAAGIQQGTLF